MAAVSIEIKFSLAPTVATIAGFRAAFDALVTAGVPDSHAISVANGVITVVITDTTLWNQMKVVLDDYEPEPIAPVGPVVTV